MKKLKLCFLAAEIEWHWWFIRRTRVKGSSLLGRGEQLSSRRICKLNRRLSMHGVKVLNAQAAYENLIRTA